MLDRYIVAVVEGPKYGTKRIVGKTFKSNLLENENLIKVADFQRGKILEKVTTTTKFGARRLFKKFEKNYQHATGGTYPFAIRGIFGDGSWGTCWKPTFYSRHNPFGAFFRGNF